HEAVLHRRRLERLLADELDEVGDRLQEPERAGPVGPIAELHAAEQLALQPGRVGERDHDQVDDHERLDERDPPHLVHDELQAIVTGPLRTAPACSSGISAVPSCSPARTRARSVTDVPLLPTVTSSPAATPRRRASARASSTSAPGRWNSSSGTRSTAAPEKSGR